jgi:hypothetical protein
MGEELKRGGSSPFCHDGCETKAPQVTKGRHFEETTSLRRPGVRAPYVPCLSAVVCEVIVVTLSPLAILFVQNILHRQSSSKD